MFCHSICTLSVAVLDRARLYLQHASMKQAYNYTIKGLAGAEQRLLQQPTYPSPRSNGAIGTPGHGSAQHYPQPSCFWASQAKQLQLPPNIVNELGALFHPNLFLLTCRQLLDVLDVCVSLRLVLWQDVAPQSSVDRLWPLVFDRVSNDPRDPAITVCTSTIAMQQDLLVFHEFVGYLSPFCFCDGPRTDR